MATEVECARVGSCPFKHRRTPMNCAGCRDNVTGKPKPRKFYQPRPPEGCGECPSCEEGHSERCSRR